MLIPDEPGTKKNHSTEKLDEQQTFFERFTKRNERAIFRLRISDGFIGLSESPSKTVQVLRSNGPWSAGVRDGYFENSIQKAYIAQILEAQHYIYIENQFFVSGTEGNEVKNKIAEAIFLKVKEKHLNNQRFIVCIILPLLPGFQGNIWEKRADILRIQVSLQLQTLSKGKNSLFEK